MIVAEGRPLTERMIRTALHYEEAWLDTTGKAITISREGLYDITRLLLDAAQKLQGREG